MNKPQRCYICSTDAGEFKREVHPSADAYVCSCVRCGNYVIRRAFIEIKGAAALSDGDRLALSAAIRDAADRERNWTEIIDADTYRIAASVVPAPRDALDQLEMFAEAIASRTRGFGDGTPADDAERWAARLFFPDRHSLLRMVEACVAMGIVVYQGVPLSRDVTFSLTFKGWDLARDARRRRRRGKQAFVAMWFHPDLGHVYEDAVAPALKDTGYVPYRSDITNAKQRVDDEMMAQLRRSSLVIADATGGRASVYYAAGFAQGLGLNVIWCCNTSYASFEPEDRPNMSALPQLLPKSWFERTAFDTRQNTFVPWSNTKELRGQLTARIRALGLDLTVAGVTE